MKDKDIFELAKEEVKIQKTGGSIIRRTNSLSNVTPTAVFSNRIAWSQTMYVSAFGGNTINIKKVWGYIMYSYNAGAQFFVIRNFDVAFYLLGAGVTAANDVDVLVNNVGAPNFTGALIPGMRCLEGQPYTEGNWPVNLEDVSFGAQDFLGLQIEVTLWRSDVPIAPTAGDTSQSYLEIEFERKIFNQ